MTRIKYIVFYRHMLWQWLACRKCLILPIGLRCFEIIEAILYLVFCCRSCWFVPANKWHYRNARFSHIAGFGEFVVWVRRLSSPFELAVWGRRFNFLIANMNSCSWLWRLGSMTHGCVLCTQYCNIQRFCRCLAIFETKKKKREICLFSQTPIFHLFYKHFCFMGIHGRCWGSCHRFGVTGNLAARPTIGHVS